jgi:hypothetical protein
MKLAFISSCRVNTCVAALPIAVCNFASLRLCDLVIKLPGYRSKGFGVDLRLNQVFWAVVCLEPGALSLPKIIEELLETKN